MQLHQSLYEQGLSSANVITLSFAPEEYLKRWLTQALFAEAPPEWFEQTHFVSDSDLSIYHAYGLGRNSRWRVYGPKILLHYALLSARGKNLPKSALDPLQRGGDFVVKGGVIQLSHVGKDQSDRPPVERVIKLLR